MEAQAPLLIRHIMITLKTRPLPISNRIVSNLRCGANEARRRLLVGVRRGIARQGKEQFYGLKEFLAASRHNILDCFLPCFACCDVDFNSRNDIADFPNSNKVQISLDILTVALSQ